MMVSPTCGGVLSPLVSAVLMISTLGLATQTQKPVAGMILDAVLVAKASCNSIANVIRFSQCVIESAIDWIKWEWAMIREYEANSLEAEVRLRLENRELRRELERWRAGLLVAAAAGRA